MVSQKNIQTVKDVSEQLKQYPVIGVIDMFKLPASQLHKIRTLLKGKATIRMVKKSLIVLAIKEAGLKGLEGLAERLQGEPALILSETNPFKLARLVDQNKSEAPAREGDIAPRDIVVMAGPTPLPPGPVIGELQKAKIPASIEGDKIHVRQDTVVVKEGEEINAILADVLSKLGIKPMEIGLNLLAVWEAGTIYGKDILFIPQEKYVQDLVSAHQSAFNLAYNSGYPTNETVPFLITKAHQEAFSLAMEAGILTPETAGPLLAKANSQAQALKSKAHVLESAAEPAGSAEQTAETNEESRSNESAKDATEPREEGNPAEEKTEEGQA